MNKNQLFGTIFLIIFNSIINCNLFSQKSKDLLYKFPDKNSSAIVDAKSLYEKIKSGSYEKINKRILSRFAEVTAFEKEKLFLSGKVYIGWSKMERYLNNVLQNILPDSLKNNPDIHVYPARIAELNAFTLFDGSIFFNIELFANVTNETSIAIILGHELGHYLMKDNLNNFIRLNKYQRKVINTSKTNKKLNYSFEYAKYSRQQETTADSIGFSLASKSGYDLYYGIDNFKRFQELEKYEELKNAPTRIYNKKNSKGQLSRSDILKLVELYPENSQRIENLNNFIKNDSTGIKNEFVINKSDFQELQEISRFETLNILLQNNPKECVKNSFIYYLFDPENADYVYYLVESLRRLISIDYKAKELAFLTDDILGKQFKKEEGILHNLSYLILDSTKMSLILPKELINDSIIEFENYEQAFEYFSNVAEKQNNREAMLSIALTQLDTAKQNFYLSKYLVNNNCWYKNYATALKNNTVNSGINTNTNDVIIYTRPEYYDFTRFGFRKDYLFETKLSQKIIRKYHSFAKSHINTRLSIIEDTSCLNWNDYINYNNIAKASLYVKENDTITKFDIEKKNTYKQVVQGLDVFSLAPENWDFVKEKNIRSIKQYFTSGTYDTRANNIGKYCIPIIILPYFIISMIANGPYGYASEYLYYSHNIINNRNYQWFIEKQRRLTKNRYFKNLKRGYKKEKKWNWIHYQTLIMFS